MKWRFFFFHKNINFNGCTGLRVLSPVYISVSDQNFGHQAIYCYANRAEVVLKPRNQVHKPVEKRNSKKDHCGMREHFVINVGASLFIWRTSYVTPSPSSWCKCHVQSLTAVPVGNSWEIGVVLKYGDGFCENVKFTILNGVQIATCVYTGRRIFWKIDGNSSVALNQMSRTAVRIAPRQERNICEERIPITTGYVDTQNPLQTQTPLRGSDFSTFRSLEARLGLLEKRVSDLDGERARKIGIGGSIYPKVVIPERVLQQLRGKMEVVLERPLQGTLDGGQFEFSIRNDVLRCSVDCCLGEYRDLCLTLENDTFVSSTFLPHSVEMDSTIAMFSCTSIHFLSFGDVCATLGEFDVDRLVCTILKSKRRRTRSNPSMIRVIGDAVLPPQGESTQIYFTIGSCLSKHTTRLCKRIVPVLQRESMVQDEIDMAFVHDLEKKMFNMEEVENISALPRIDTESSGDYKKNAKRRMKSSNNQIRGFQMHWIPQRNSPGNHLFENRKQTLARSGHLELLLPTFYCYNISQCDEMLKVCTKDFLKLCVQRLSSPK